MTEDAAATPFVHLTTTGRRTGLPRRTQLIRVTRGGQYVVVASAQGRDAHPAWYLNLLAAPDVLLEDGGRALAMTARVADAAERARWWPVAVAAHPAYAGYRDGTTREIPIVVLTPRSAATDGTETAGR